MDPAIDIHPIHQARISKLERQVADLERENAARGRLLIATENQLHGLRLAGLELATAIGKFNQQIADMLAARHDGF